MNLNEDSFCIVDILLMAGEDTDHGAEYLVPIFNPPGWCVVLRSNRRFQPGKSAAFRLTPSRLNMMHGFWLFFPQ